MGFSRFLDILRASERGQLERVATPATLRMKRNTIRPIDKADAAALARLFHLEDT